MVIAVAAVLSNWHNVLRAINMASSELDPMSPILKLRNEIHSENPQTKGRSRDDREWGSEEESERYPSATDPCPDTHRSSRLVNMVALLVYTSDDTPAGLIYGFSFRAFLWEVSRLEMAFR